jgi:hypothetical protein
MEEPAPKPPAWLQHLQENSWEAEILISGGAIFSLFQLADGLSNTLEYLKEMVRINGLNLIFLLLMTALRGITITFILHLLLRGLWIAIVCVNAVYPLGTNYSKLKLRPEYLDPSKKVDLTRWIVKLDELSGLIFSASFLFIIIILGVIFLFSTTMYPLSFFVTSDAWMNLILLILISVGLIYVLDFILSGPLRKNRILGTIYFPVFSIYNMLTLGFIYRPLVQIISTNINRLKAGVFLTALFVSSLTFAYVTLQRPLRTQNLLDGRQYPATENPNVIADDLYMDHIPDDTRISRACVQSDFVKDDFLRLFIPYRAQYDNYIAGAKKDTFSQIVTVTLNDSVLQKVDWIEYKRRVTKQSGLVAYLPIIPARKGRNEVVVQIAGLYYDNSKSDKLVIPFWKE